MADALAGAGQVGVITDHTTGMPVAANPAGAVPTPDGGQVTLTTGEAILTAGANSPHQPPSGGSMLYDGGTGTLPAAEESRGSMLYGDQPSTSSLLDAVQGVPPNQPPAAAVPQPQQIQPDNGMVWQMQAKDRYIQDLEQRLASIRPFELALQMGGADAEQRLLDATLGILQQAQNQNPQATPQQQAQAAQKQVQAVQAQTTDPQLQQLLGNVLRVIPQLAARQDEIAVRMARADLETSLQQMERTEPGFNRWEVLQYGLQNGINDVRKAYVWMSGEKEYARRHGMPWGGQVQNAPGASGPAPQQVPTYQPTPPQTAAYWQQPAQGVPATPPPAPVNLGHVEPPRARFAGPPPATQQQHFIRTADWGEAGVMAERMISGR